MRKGGFVMLYSEEQEHQYVRELSELTGGNWEWDHTGGGCTAITLNLDFVGAGVDGDHYLMVTHSEDASIPCPTDPHTLGEYLDGGISPNWWYFANRSELVDFLGMWIGHRVK
jgi:hypothetical protein